MFEQRSAMRTLHSPCYPFLALGALYLKNVKIITDFKGELLKMKNYMFLKAVWL